MAKETEQHNQEQEKPVTPEQETETVSPAEAADPEQLGTEETETAAEELEAATDEEKEQSAEIDGSDEAESLRKELEEQQNKYLRLFADYENYKRRAQKEREEAEKFRSKSLLTDLLPVLDNFERALAAAPKNEENESLLKGLDMVYSSLQSAVQREGLEEVKAVGEPFDPNVHQAVMQDKDESKESGVVLQELQKGYTLKGRVLRPSMVKVNE